ncbi:MAG: hypothetical protein WAO55_01005 [Candidatus Manganitrophaceae bacterium]
MIKKIKKKIQKGPKAVEAVPMAIALTALYGPRREGKDFRHRFERADEIRSVLQLHLEQPLILADRPLSAGEYLSWGLKSRPARLAEMFSKSGILPMGEAVESDDPEEQPRLGILPMVALVQEREIDDFSERLMEEFAEVSRTALQNAIYPALGLIPGYDLLLYSLPSLAQGLNHAIDSLNASLREAFEQAAVSFPGPFSSLPESVLGSIPLKETCVK